MLLCVSNIDTANNIAILSCTHVCPQQGCKNHFPVRCLKITLAYRIRSNDIVFDIRCSFITDRKYLS